MPKPQIPSLKKRTKQILHDGSLEGEIKKELLELKLRIDAHFAEAQKRIRVQTEKKA